MKFKELAGKTISKIEGKVGDERITFTFTDGSIHVLFHEQDCCEYVYVEDICGDLDDLVGSPIVQAEESMSETDPEGVERTHNESYEWTFYRIATAKGSVTIRWYGESDYYSVSVTFA